MHPHIARGLVYVYIHVFMCWIFVTNAHYSVNIHSDEAVKTVNLTCPIQLVLQRQSNKVVYVRWTYQNDAFIAKAKPGTVGFILDEEKYEVPSLDVLTIRDVQVKDDGRYRCVVLYQTDILMREQHSVLLNIFVPFTSQFSILTIPEIPSNDTVLPRGSSVTIAFTALLGRPKANILWFKDGHQINQSSDILISTNHTSSFKLYNSSSYITIQKLQPQHSGNYSCKASNKYGLSEENYYYFDVGEGKDTGHGTLESWVWVPIAVFVVAIVCVGVIFYRKIQRHECANQPAVHHL